MRDPLPNKNRADDAGDLEDALRSLSRSGERPLLTVPDIQIDKHRGDSVQRDDDRFLHRFFAFCIVMAGIATTLPAVHYWVGDSAAVELRIVPRWVYLLGFVGALHLLYAFLAFQVPDYSTLWSLAGLLLIVTCVYGFTGIALWLGDGNGPAPRLLQIASIVRDRAAIWCGVMFGVSALGCYVFGREALLHRRKVIGWRRQP